jgi:hypothetical protein
MVPYLALHINFRSGCVHQGVRAWTQAQFWIRSNSHSFTPKAFVLVPSTVRRTHSWNGVKILHLRETQF